MSDAGDEDGPSRSDRGARRLIVIALVAQLAFAAYMLTTSALGRDRPLFDIVLLVIWAAFSTAALIALTIDARRRRRGS